MTSLDGGEPAHVPGDAYRESKRSERGPLTNANECPFELDRTEPRCPGRVSLFLFLIGECVVAHMPQIFDCISRADIWRRRRAEPLFP
jgi:hypothetical protein